MSKRILINDADPALAERVRGILAGQGRGFDVLTTSDGAAALEIVRRLPVDLVITGLDTPKVDGLQLLTELTRNHPQVRVIVMVGPRTTLPRAVIRLMGAARTQEQPLDLRDLTTAVFAELQIRHRGEVWGILLTSFLQMLNADLKTCTVTVRAGDAEGQLFIAEGELIAAECGAERGDDAVYTVLSWNDPQIELDYLPFERTRDVSAGLMGLLLEAQRRRDTARSDAEQMRRAPRFNCLVAVDFDLASGSYRHLIRNLSEGGAFIESDSELTLGETVELLLFSIRRHQHCTVRGRIVRRQEAGYGVQFVDLDEAQRAFLRAETAPAPAAG